MIHVAPTPQLSPRTRYGLDVLIDLSRLVPVREGAPVLVRLETEEAPSSGDWEAPPIEVTDRVVRIPTGFLDRVASVAGAVHEQQSGDSDALGRKPPEANELVRSQRADRPVLNIAAAQLREAVRRSAAGGPFAAFEPWPDGHRWAVTVTHDVDVVEWWGLFTAARLAELLRNGHAGLAMSAAASALRALGKRPALDGIRHVLDAEARRGIPATWYFLCDDPSPGKVLRKDTTYRPDARATRQAIAWVNEAGHEIGLHGSLESGQSDGLLRKQRERLAALSGQPVHGVRQHFLRMQPGITQRRMESAGFHHDATFGFADRSGFRLGGADIVPGWDEERNAPTGLDEVPLHWMDRTESKYRRIEDPVRWIESGLESAEAARAVEGMWSFVWHPYLTDPLGFPGAPAAFEALLDRLGEWKPLFARVGDLVAWRRLRRNLTGELAEGTLRLRGRDASVSTIGVEDGDGLRRVLPIEATGG